MEFLDLVLGLALGYGAFVALRTGLLRRLPLALGPISLEAIPDRAARRYGDRVLFTTETPCAWEVPALRERYPDRFRWSARRVRSTAAHVAGALRERLGLRHGERVAILKENHFDVHVLIAAVVRSGGVACPMNWAFPSAKLGPYLANVGARVLISDRATALRILRERANLAGVATLLLADRRKTSDRRLEDAVAASHSEVEVVWLEEALMEVGRECPAVPRGKNEPLYLVHTSGTTGFPKAVTLKNGPQSHAVRGWLCYVHLSPRFDRGYLAVPNHHQAVILSFNSLLLLGLPVHWNHACGRDDGFDPERVVEALSRGRFTGFFGFPVTYTQLKEVPLERHDLRRMKVWASTADASHAEIVRRFVRFGGAFRALGIPLEGSVFLDAQGSSEVGTPSVLRYVTPFTRTFDRRIGRPGSTPFGPAVRIVHRDGRRAVRDEVGRLEVKGRTVFDGYWNDCTTTLLAMRDGWFFTGDVARGASDGHIVQLDREVDVIHTVSGPVYSLPIEEKLHAHPAVYDVCVYGARQPDGTQRPAAAVALREGFSGDNLRSELNGLVRREERLVDLEILPWKEFPMGVTGKTLKRVFRERTEPAPVPEAYRPRTAERRHRAETSGAERGNGRELPFRRMYTGNLHPLSDGRPT